MLSFKQCTVLLFAGKLMWFLFRQLEHKLKKLVRCFEGMKRMCFHAAEKDVQPPPPHLDCSFEGVHCKQGFLIGANTFLNKTILQGRAGHFSVDMKTLKQTRTAWYYFRLGLMMHWNTACTQAS